MKKIIGTIVLAFALAFTAYTEGIAEGPGQASEDLDTSYAIGIVLGADLKQTGLTLNYNAFIRGLRDAMENRNMKLSMDDAILKVQLAFVKAMEQQAEENKQKERQFLEENGKKPGIMTTASGLQYEVITEGTGEKPSAADMVRVNYEGTLTNGTVFDSSYARGEPAEFGLNAVISGWTEGIQMMSEGSIYRFYIPSNLAYGEREVASIIPSYSTLIFKIELLEIIKTPEESSDIDLESLKLDEDEDVIYIPIE
jgi:FKBP-type peptidyl-prolyl cis-trans isomerase